MKKLWAPWRKGYILGKPSRKCFICVIKSSRNDTKNLIVKRSKHSLAILNLYPYNNGHLMIVPSRHVKDLSLLRQEQILDLVDLMNLMIKRLNKTMKPHAFNIGINMGKAAGAGLPGHVHIHIVPRWSGDTNFMPVLNSTKLISESLSSVYKTLALK